MSKRFEVVQIRGKRPFIVFDNETKEVVYGPQKDEYEVNLVAKDMNDEYEERILGE